MIKEIGKRIRYARKSQNMTLKDLSTATGLSINYIGQIERGVRNDVGVCTLNSILNALQMSLFLPFSIADNPSSDEKYEEMDHLKISALYPKKIGVYPVTTLLEFWIYLPLFQFHELYDVLCRIDGSIIGSEHYILNQINRLVENIPSSTAKTYADSVVKLLSKPIEYMNNPYDDFDKKSHDAYSKVIEEKRISLEKLPQLLSQLNIYTNYLSKK